MKPITIQANYVGLQFKDGQCVRVLKEGNHRIGFFEDYNKFDLSMPVALPINMDVALRNKELADLLEVVEVGQNQIALKFTNNQLVEVKPAGRYIFWKSATASRFELVDLSDLEIPDTYLPLLASPLLAPYCRPFRVEQYEMGVLLVEGKFQSVLNPGIYRMWVNSTIVNISKADIRQTAAEILGQEILTNDKAQLRVNFYYQFRVVDVVKAVLENKEYERQLYVGLQMALREVIGRLSFDELMAAKDKVADEVMALYKERAASLGVELLGGGIKDIVLPGDIKEIMNQVLIAEKRAQANIITRREETASTRSLLNTAKLMEDNAMLYKLKEMEYVEKIAEKIHTISLSGSGQIVDQLKQIFVK